MLFFGEPRSAILAILLNAIKTEKNHGQYKKA